MMPTFSMLWEEIQVFWFTWDLEIACAVIFVGAMYFAVRWMLRCRWFYRKDTED
jgi:hypothetical protein